MDERMSSAANSETRARDPRLWENASCNALSRWVLLKRLQADARTTIQVETSDIEWRAGRSSGDRLTQLSILWALKATSTSPPNATVALPWQWMGRDHARECVWVNSACRNEGDISMLRTGFPIRGLGQNTAMADLDGPVPLGPVARPEDIADVVLFLASDTAPHMCDALVEVNGGRAVA
ncbi:hypothetical protein [Mesorhizobium sp. M0435]|uniref:hypothetical protein n=1 Tax=Mesorhizobium sp. M0435 TaxID=2956944 RepID=UPI0033368358